MTFLSKAMDERFFEYRRRSTSMAGVAAGVLAIGLFAYRHYHDGLWDWDLLVVGVTFAGVKLAVMAWYYLAD